MTEDQQPKKRGRKPGQKNKPSCIAVPLQRVNEYLKEPACVLVSRKWAVGLGLVDDDEIQVGEQGQKTEMTIIDDGKNEEF